MDILATSDFPLITFIDIEASGLDQPDSYPIEVGWADTLGNSDGFLICPLEDWTHWSPTAESIHGIKRKELFEKGLPVDEAAERLNDMLGCEVVFCDGLDSDQFWLNRLYEAASVAPSFELADFHQVHKLLSKQHMLSLQHALKSQPIPHRAQADAERYANAVLASYPKEDPR
ncbi:hypothetical protein [Vreelandella nanhaiensis]|uniref:Exonuclease domain-containing protein n=1 Tax=Vreelandella nanhaiensis TaxID=1258546 RepID=A0A3S0YX93_9GAMM|nr:hypothetical protein [Halomonas nanhaiensis]RUR31815.1 hypothetical protein ELY38_10240 [Halomonas nanhaiensis]